MNNNRKDAAALQARCKGVFSNVGFLSEATEEGAEEKQEASRDSYKGKQFLPSCAKSGRTPDTYFGLDKEKKHLYIAEIFKDKILVQGLPFVDREKFQETQPEKPGKGFLTSDYNRRGEFTNTIRTEQYRAQLKQEEKITKKRPPHESPPGTLNPSPQLCKEEEFLYDRVYDRSPPKRAAQKLPRDTGNPTMLGKERSLGPSTTTYVLQFCRPQQVSLPKHGRVAVVRDTFYDKDMSAFSMC